MRKSNGALLPSGTSKVETLQLKITFFRTCALIRTSKYKTTRFFLHSSVYYKMTLNLALGCPFPAHILKTDSRLPFPVCCSKQGDQCLAQSEDSTSDESNVLPKVPTWKNLCFLLTEQLGPLSPWFSGSFIFWWFSWVYDCLLFHAFTELPSL